MSRQEGAEGFRVTETIRGAHPMHTGYALYPGDLLVREDGPTWMKEAPGLAIGGFVLTAEQEASLHRVMFQRHGLAYTIVGDPS